MLDSTNLSCALSASGQQTSAKPPLGVAMQSIPHKACSREYRNCRDCHIPLCTVLRTLCSSGIVGLQIAIVTCRARGAGRAPLKTV